MDRYNYDIEIFPNLFCVTFLNLETKESKLFSIYKTRNDLAKLEKFLDQEIVLIGYNNLNYDGPMIQYLLQNKSSKNIVEDLFDFSTKLINTERGYFNQAWKQYQYPENVKYAQIDLMKIIEISGIAPSLKQIAITLQWWRIQDLPLPYNYIVQTEEEEKLIYEYNLNDVYITDKLYEELLPKIELREGLTQLYGVNLMSASDSKMADKILEKFYVDELNADMKIIKNLRTKREQFFLSDCIAPNIKFETNFFNRIKQEIAETLVRKSNNYKYAKTIEFGGVIYELGVGGIHSVDFPAKFISNEEFRIADNDVASFYPSMMINNKIIPEHLGLDFIRVLERITKERLAAKKTNKVKAEALKITINAIFGKLGSDTFWLEDPKALRSVTVSGQLYLLMLIEKLVLNGIQVISANTDGVVSRIHKDQEKLFSEISEWWQKETNLILERTDYSVYFRQDVNNYITIKSDGHVKEKGKYLRERNVKKGYKHPIVPIAMYEFVVNNIPLDETIRNHKNILDFCISQKSNREFKMEYHSDNGEIQSLQKNNRFFISNSGGALQKRRENDSLIGIAVGEKITILNDYDSSKPFEEYDIKYQYYIDEAKKYTDGINLYEENLVPFIDEDEDYSPPVDNKKRSDFFFQFQKVKNLPEKFVDGLMWLTENFPENNTNFCDYLKFATDGCRISSKILQMIKLNYFVKFGNQKKLIKFYEEFTSGPNKYTKTLSDKSKEKRILLLQEYWLWIKEEEFTILEQIQNEASVNTIPFSKYEVSNFYAYIIEINDKHSSRAKLKCYKLLTGDEREIEIYKNDMEYQRKQDTEPKKLKVGDVILCKSLPKQFYKTRDENNKWVNTTKSYRLLASYYVMDMNDKFFPPEVEETPTKTD